MDLKSIQKPLKERYRSDPGTSRITLKAQGSQEATPIACSVDIGRAVYEAQAHTGVGGAGTAACSGDLLLGALAACAQITCQMVATAMGIPTDRIAVEVTGDLDLRGTLGISREVPVGFEIITLNFDIVAPAATATRSGRCFAICPASVSTDRPAASATTLYLSGKASTTSSAERPIDPVEPSTESDFMVNPRLYRRRSAVLDALAGLRSNVEDGAAQFRP